METKPILTSQTIRGAIQLLFIVLGLAGIQITEDEKMGMTETLVAVLSGIWAMYAFVQVVRGRIATKKDLTIGGKVVGE